MKKRPIFKAADKHENFNGAQNQINIITTLIDVLMNVVSTKTLNFGMNSMNSMITRIRTVNMNSRGQIVIPEEMRKSLNLSDKEALLLIQEDNKITIEKESELMKKISEKEENEFWEKMSLEAMKTAWSKEDDVWDKIWEEELK